MIKNNNYGEHERETIMAYYLKHLKYFRKSIKRGRSDKYNKMSEMLHFVNTGYIMVNIATIFLLLSLKVLLLNLNLSIDTPF